MKSVFFVYRVTDRPYGGINSFNRALKETLQRHPQWGVTITPAIREADVIFLSAASRGPDSKGRDGVVKPWHLRNLVHRRSYHHPAALFGSWNGGLPVVHRLDGLTTRYGRADGHEYDDLQKQLNKAAHTTIFQSTFCQRSFRENVFDSSDKVIPNGVDGTLFPWIARRAPDNIISLAAMSWSSNPVKGHAIYAELSKIPGVEVLFLGRWPSSVDKAGVRIINAVPQKELARFLHQTHAFVHAAENDPAPNVVTEALTTGLPILYLASGGTEEIVQGSQYGVALKGLDRNSLEQSIEELRKRYVELRDNIAQDRARFLIETAGKAYADVFVGVQ